MYRLTGNGPLWAVLRACLAIVAIGQAVGRGRALCQGLRRWPRRGFCSIKSRGCACFIMLWIMCGLSRDYLRLSFSIISPSPCGIISIMLMRFSGQKKEDPPILGRPPLQIFRPSIFRGPPIMENVGDKALSQSVVGFHQRYFGSLSPEAKPYALLQSIQIGRATPAYQCWPVHGMWQGIEGLYRICLEWLRLGHQQALEALRRMSQGLCVLHRILIASAECVCWLQSATRSESIRLHHVPYGTPKWVKTRLAASLRQGLIVILSAKSSHA